MVRGCNTGGIAGGCALNVASTALPLDALGAACRIGPDTGKVRLERPRAAGTARAVEVPPNIPAPVTAQPAIPSRRFVGDLEPRCQAAGVKPKSKHAVGLALAARFTKSKANGGEIHYGAQLRKGLAVVAA